WPPRPRGQRHNPRGPPARPAASGPRAPGPAADLVGSAPAADTPSAPGVQRQPAPVQATSAQASSAQPTQTEQAQGDGSGQVQAIETAPLGAADAAGIPVHMAGVERGRIAMMGGVVSVVWLGLLGLMVLDG